MKIALAVFALFTVSLATAADNQPLDDLRILETGCFHGSEIDPIADDTNWLGLYPTDSGYVLSSVGVTDSKCHDIVVDEDGDTTGVMISVDSPDDPRFLIQTDGSLTVGRVPIYVSRTIFINSDTVITFDRYRLVGHGDVDDEEARPDSDPLFLNYTVTLYDDHDSSQVLVHYDRASTDGTPQLLWAGDLDGDNRADLILDITNHYNVRHLALYLSSKAAPEKLVKLVAQLRLTGC